jgi:serine/threonine-protein phosphatase 2A regulatory subunit A
VRAALALVISGLAPILGKEETGSALVELVIALLRDEVAEVRLNVISRIEELNRVAGVDGLVTTLLPAIFELAKDRQWRVRLEVIQFVPLLAAELGPNFFDEKLNSLCMSWLTDNVFAIREAAIANVRKLTETFGVDWAQANIIPSILNLHSHPNYLHRMTTLFSISAISAVAGQTVIANSLLPLVLRMAQDKVANIRFNVAKTLQALIPHIDAATVQSRVKPCLQKLTEDSDRDVKFYATQALALCV